MSMELIQNGYAEKKDRFGEEQNTIIKCKNIKNAYDGILLHMLVPTSRDSIADHVQIDRMVAEWGVSTTLIKMHMIISAC